MTEDRQAADGSRGAGGLPEHFVFELERREGLVGALTDALGRSRSFDGWMSFMAALDELRATDSRAT